MDGKTVKDIFEIISKILCFLCSLSRSDSIIAAQNYTTNPANRRAVAFSLPSSDCWLEEEKRIWRNESDWKEYMQKVEQKKIKK